MTNDLSQIQSQPTLTSQTFPVASYSTFGIPQAYYQLNKQMCNCNQSSGINPIQFQQTGTQQPTGPVITGRICSGTRCVIVGEISVPCPPNSGLSNCSQVIIECQRVTYPC